MPSPDPIDDLKSGKPIDLPVFLLQVLEGNLSTAEALGALVDKVVKLTDRMTTVAYLMLAALGLFLLGQITMLIATLIRVGMIGG
jgi:hypothetical protein